MFRDHFYQIYIFSLVYYFVLLLKFSAQSLKGFISRDLKFSRLNWSEISAKWECFWKNVMRFFTKDLDKDCTKPIVERQKFEKLWNKHLYFLRNSLFNYFSRHFLTWLFFTTGNLKTVSKSRKFILMVLNTKNKIKESLFKSFSG